MRTITRRFLPLLLAIAVVVLIFAWIQLRIEHIVVEQRADSLEDSYMDERSYIERLQTDNRTLRQASAVHQELVDGLGSDLKEQATANSGLRDRVRKLLGSEIAAQATIRAKDEELKRLRQKTDTP
jgi:hypothetical protein